MNTRVDTAAPDQRIFVQVAAYRDPELLPTLRHCIANADQPQQLTFGICWQHAEDDSLAEFASMPQARVKDVHYSLARGTCWARSETQRLYDGEEYTLQIDSHHRFAPGWDTTVKALMLEARRAGAKKPLLTSYLPPYEPGDADADLGGAPLRLVFNGFSAEGPFKVMPVAMDGPQRRSRLERARFLSGHFLFTLGEFCREVPYDPRLYFFGEEPAMALRAFTHGYDLFHPRLRLLWHHYHRPSAPRHWSDNRRWWLRNERSLQQYRRLVDPDGASDLGSFGLGTTRSLADYEAYAGIALSARKVTQDTLRGVPPGHSRLARWRRARLLPEHVVTLPLTGIPANLGQHPDDFLYIGIHDAQQREILRQDLTGASLSAALAAGDYLLRLHSRNHPATWTLWPWQTQSGWGDSIRGSVDSCPGERG